MGLGTFSGVLPNHFLTGLVGVEHHQQTCCNQQTTQQFHRPAGQRLAYPIYLTFGSIHFVPRLQSK